MQPLGRPAMPAKFTWTPMRVGDNPWLYQVFCKVCRWEKLSDYENVIEHAQLHDCKRSR